MSSPRADDEVIDVVSDGPAILQTRGRRSLTLQGTDDQGRFEETPTHADQDEDEDEDVASTPEEHAYRRGRQAIPMDSPGDEMRHDLLIDDDDDDDDAQGLRGARLGVRRLRRLRARRGFFQSDGDVRSFRYRSSGGIRQRITLRRRKEGEQDVFWTLIFVLTILSFALMSVISIYLTQTDFFESHQNDLFGTTVDNRFTVVAEDDAQIFLKSGYSKTVYSEAMIAFDDGELQIGRRALASAETQNFYGVSFFTNGTAAFTNRVESPMFEGDYIHARKAVVFEDGTVMTTAANSSGGVKEHGDLNLVSQAGSVVTSVGGHSVLFVEPSGTVTVANTGSDAPISTGITLDGVGGSLSIRGGLTLAHNDNSSSLSTDQALRLNTSTILMGSPSSGTVRLTVASDDGGNDVAEDGGDGARALETTRSGEESESVTMELSGQTTTTQKEGGDIRVVGGDGLEIGGDVVLVGGQATGLTSSQYGTITVNAGLDQTASSLTEIGSHSASHVVNVHGFVTFNNKAQMNNATHVKVAGGGFNVSAQRITLDNRATESSQLRINSNSLQLGVSSPSIQVGKFGLSKLGVEGSSISFDASKAIAVGESSASIVVGNGKTTGQVTKMESSAIHLDASRSISINTRNTKATTTISGLIHFNGSSTTESLVSIADAAIRVNSPKFRVGPKGKTTVASIEATHISIGGPGANSTVLPPSGSTLDLMSATINIGTEASETSLTGKRVVVDAEDTLAIGEEVDSVAIGSEDVGAVNVQGDTVTITGATSFAVEAKRVAVGTNTTNDVAVGASTVKTATFEAKSIKLGSTAQEVSIGVGSPTINIGSDDTVINLSGSVTVNGKELGGRRLTAQRGAEVEPHSKRFGYLNAARVVVGINTTESRSQFDIRWDSGFSSEPQTYAVEARKERMLSISPALNEGESTRHIQLSLHVASALLAVQNSSKIAVGSSSKIRCCVYQHSAANSDTIALEVNAPVEHCVGALCDDDFFVGFQGQRIVPYAPGDSFSTQCTLASAAGGELILREAQYSFVTMQQ